MTSDAVKILDRAVELVSENWGQGGYVHSDCFCAATALKHASFENFLSSPSAVDGEASLNDIIKVLDNILGPSGGAPFSRLVEFNDVPGGTVDDVVELFAIVRSHFDD